MKIIAAFAVTIISLSANAQVIRAGVNFANITITNDGSVDDNKMLTSFQVGILGNLKIAPMISLQSGVLFTGKGSKTQSGDPNSSTYYTATSNPFYLEVPANLIFKTPTGPIKFFAGAGPYLAVGIAGKNKVQGKVLGAAFDSENEIEWSNDDPGTLNYEEGAGYGILRRFDYGLNGIAGIETSNIVLSAGYGYGLAKLQSGTNSSADDKNKHRVVSVTLGIKL